MSSLTTYPALTTTFTPPTTCLLPTYTLAPGGQDSINYSHYSLFGSSLLTVFERGIVTECYPPGFWLATTTPLTNGSGTFTLAATYSPGLNCPVGYYTAQQTTIPFDVNMTSYGAVCCPS